MAPIANRAKVTKENHDTQRKKKFKTKKIRKTSFRVFLSIIDDFI
jgi:hypothetical protein